MNGGCRSPMMGITKTSCGIYNYCYQSAVACKGLHQIYCEYWCHNWRPLHSPHLSPEHHEDATRWCGECSSKWQQLYVYTSVGLANQRGGGGECGAFLWRLNPRQFPAMFALSLERGCVNNSDVSCRECWPWCWWSSCWRLPFTDLLRGKEAVN